MYLPHSPLGAPTIASTFESTSVVGQALSLSSPSLPPSSLNSSSSPPASPSPSFPLLLFPLSFFPAANSITIETKSLLCFGDRNTCVTHSARPATCPVNIQGSVETPCDRTMTESVCDSRRFWDAVYNTFQTKAYFKIKQPPGGREGKYSCVSSGMGRGIMEK